MDTTSALLLYYSNILVGERVALGAMLVILFGMIFYRQQRKSSAWLLVTVMIQTIHLMGDSATYDYAIHANMSYGLASIFYFIAYTFTALTMIAFCMYAKSYIEEKTTVNKWVFRVPVILEVFVFIIASVSIAMGTVYGNVDGEVSQIGSLPTAATIIPFLVVIYIPAVALTKVKKLGWKAVLLLGLFGILPGVVSLISYDYSLIVSSLALLIVYVLLQCDTTAEKEKQRKELSDLNARLQDNQTRLEESSAEQEAQIEEITALNHSLAEYNDIMSNAGFGMWHIYLNDAAAPRMAANEKMAELLGIAGQTLTEEETYASWYDRIVPDAIPSVQTSVGEMLEGRFSENTYQWQHPTKGIIYVRCGGTAARLKDGTDVLSGYHADVTDIVLAEQKQKAEREQALSDLERSNTVLTRIHELLGSATWAVWYGDKHTPVKIEWSDELRHLLGFTDETDFPNTADAFYSRVHPDDLTNTIEKTQKDITGMKATPNYSQDIRIRCKNGEYRWFRNVASPVRRKDGSAEMVYGVLMDITDAEKVQTELKKAFESAQVIHESLGAANWEMTCDAAGNVTSCIWGSHLRNMLGYTTEEFPDTIAGWADKIHPQDKEMVRTFSQNMIHNSDAKTNYRLQYRMRTKNRDYRWYLSCAQVSRDSNGILQAVYGVLMDIDDQVLANQGLQQARAAAEAANSAKTSFLFNMSHDIRTPMNAIIGYTQLIEKHQGNREKCDDYLKKIRSSGEFLLSLINNILELARIESGKSELDETICDTSCVQDAIVGVFSEMMQKKRITFNRSMNLHTKYVWGDRVKLNQIFLNLVSNAYKYTPEGGTIEMKLEELPGDRPGWINMRTTLKDNGIGMSKDYLPHLFEEFSREHNMTESKIQGTGLGMPIVKKLVDLMGGTITVESEPGKGTTFVVTIPNRIADEAQPQAEAAVTVDVNQFAGKRLLLAEDNDLNAEIAIEILEEVGFRVERAEDGIICVDMLQKASRGYYNVILMDIQMPNMNGYKATEIIRHLSDTEKAGIPILAMTANAFEEDKKNAIAAGMNGHLAKPIEIPKLMQALASVLIP